MTGPNTHPRLAFLERLRDRFDALGIDPAEADRFFWDELDPERRAAYLNDFRIRTNDRRFLEGVAPFVKARRGRALFRGEDVQKVARLSPADRRPQDDAFERGNDALRSVEAERFLEVLVPESEPSRGRCRCPWPNEHEDRHPSASYNSTAFFCHPCGEGGGIFELGAALTGRSLTGPDFLEVRRFLAERLLGAGV